MGSAPEWLELAITLAGICRSSLRQSKPGRIGQAGSLPQPSVTGWRIDHYRLFRQGSATGARINLAFETLYVRLAALAEGGAAPGANRAMDIAEEHRRLIATCNCDCTYETHLQLAEMYVRDAAYTTVHEGISPGLAAYLRAAIRANAMRNGS